MMKETANYRHRIFYMLICIVFFSSFLSLLATDKVKADTSFAFSLTVPANNSFLSGPDVTFSGTYTIDSTKTLRVTMKDNSSSAQPITVNANDGSWSYTYKNMKPGLHNITFTGTDSTTSIPVDISFTVARPAVSSIKLVSDSIENGTAWGTSDAEDMTHVPLSSKIQLTVKSDNQLAYTVKSSEGTTTVYNSPVTITSASGKTVHYADDGSAPPSVGSNGNYVITITPSDLQPNTTYYVNVTKDITDKDGNSIYPETIKFTTASNSNADNPHGKYFTGNDNSRANLCATCHSTHNGATDGLLGGHFIKNPKQSPTDSNTVNYCMACHDGTSAPKANDMEASGSVHDQQIDSKHLANEGSCSSCHDPHVTWSQNDPNLFKGHYTYTHNSDDKDSSGQQIGAIDSFTQPCELCHNYPTSTDGTKTYYSAKDAKTQSGVKFNFLHFRENMTRAGNTNNNLLEDTDVCLRCHNGTMKQQNKVNSDIQTYYSDSSSLHNFAAMNGSQVSGQMSCAECHDSHGSSNSLLLKSTLGQDYQNGSFSVTGVASLTAAQEREFCLKCHNGSTEVYGIRAQAPVLSTNGHENADKLDLQDQQNLPACSSCHGGKGEDQALRAAHDPLNP